ncbi:MAG: hypothetical protein GY771_11765, partial [bacterium]|nr:hypothetical protein [bacterium]
ASIAIVLDDYEKAVEYLIAAARRASVYGIHYETINILTYALGVAEDNRISDSQLAELYRMRGDIYVREGVVSASALDYEAASKLCAPDSGSHIDIELRKCRLLSDSGSIDETLDILNGINIEAIPQKIKVSRDIEEAYGDVYRSSNKPGTAESHYGRALELAEEKDVLYRLLTKLGQIKSAIGDTNGAIELLEKAYYLGQEIDDYILTAEAALKLSKILPYRLDVERSIYLAQQALRRYLDIYDYKNAADSYSSLANTALLAGDIDDFSENVERGKNTLAKHPKNNILVRFYLLQARFKLIIGDEDGFNEVIKHRSLKLRCLEDPETAIAVYLLKSEFATQITRDFENALRYVQKAMLILDKHAVLRLTRHAGITYAGVQRELGKPIEALRTLSNPELRDYINNNQLLQLDYYRVLGLALADTGKKEEGVSKLKLAAALSKDNRVKYSEGRAYIEMAPILGDDEAIDVVNRAVWLFDSMDSLFWRKRAEGVLSRPGKAGI